MNERGFTLMELMITVVVIGILAAIAIPAYTGHVTRTKRSEAVTALQTVALNQEKNMAEKGGYATSISTLMTNTGMKNPDTDNYDVELAANPAPTTTTFTAIATPKSSFDDKANINPTTKKTLIFAIQQDGSVGTYDFKNAGFETNDELWKSLRP